MSSIAETGFMQRLLVTCLLMVVGCSHSPPPSAKLREDEFFQAASLGDLQTLRRGLSDGFSANLKNSAGTTAAMVAAKAGQSEALHVLHAGGADLSWTDAEGDNVMTFAIQGRHRSVVETLLREGVIPDLPVYKNLTPLIVALVRNQVGIAEALVKAGANVNFIDPDGDTPLIIATEKSQEDLIEPLLRAGADRKFKDADGKTALDLAFESRNSRLVAKLKGAR